MATNKKQVSNTKKPKSKSVAAEGKVKSAAVASEVIRTEESNVEEKPQVIISRRVWPD